MGLVSVGPGTERLNIRGEENEGKSRPTGKVTAVLVASLSIDTASSAVTVDISSKCSDACARIKDTHTHTRDRSDQQCVCAGSPNAPFFLLIFHLRLLLLFGLYSFFGLIWRRDYIHVISHDRERERTKREGGGKRKVIDRQKGVVNQKWRVIKSRRVCAMPRERKKRRDAVTHT